MRGRGEGEGAIAMYRDWHQRAVSGRPETRTARSWRSFDEPGSPATSGRPLTGARADASVVAARKRLRQPIQRSHFPPPAWHIVHGHVRKMVLSPDRGEPFVARTQAPCTSSVRSEPFLSPSISLRRSRIPAGQNGPALEKDTADSRSDVSFATGSRCYVSPSPFRNLFRK